MEYNIPPKAYLMLQRSTENDIHRIKIGLSEKEIQNLDELTEITGHHKSDYEAEVPFESNYNDGNEDWLEP